MKQTTPDLARKKAFTLRVEWQHKTHPYALPIV
ncbi:hypothetical protein EcWSU1_01088 [Enterobacter ludwigii]|uniref:Uncharacterized protein n=1 Tax=Enterobacter ludwigii TaxID=299767 RepID=G8LCY0_9ENTR|nr:hypothetical protein EcWSU1_01088 [Enterobacter ludwigii]